MFSKLFGKKKAEERQEKIEVAKNPQYLAAQLCDLLKEEGAELKEDSSIYLPAYDLSIRIAVEEITKNSATLNFYLNCPKWDRQLFECCASPGKDVETAVGLALGSFAFGMFSGVRAMCQGEEKCRVETTFEGKTHRWTVYQSNLLGVGSSPEPAPGDLDYWSFLVPQLSQYLGDRKISFIKIFGASYNGKIVGECRVNDLTIAELGKQVEEIVAGWKVSDYCTQKQFFFLVQDDETCHPYPYTQEQITDKVQTALSVFERLLQDKEGYDRCPEELAKALGDPHLAAEMFSFLPEFCAHWEFPALQPSEQLSMSFDGELHQYSISQISAFYLLMTSLEKLIVSRELSRELFVKLVSISAAWNVVCSAKEQGQDLTKDGGQIHTVYFFPDGYRPR